MSGVEILPPLQVTLPQATLSAEPGIDGDGDLDDLVDEVQVDRHDDPAAQFLEVDPRLS